uniref:PI-PLC Y-box domain-containing protein n=1 Tax=viral metagenome TaxID=1070528 RepID=A0A6C0I788_9ZZZZ
MEPTILLMILVFSVIIYAFLYYFYYTGTGNFLGGLLIPILMLICAFVTDGLGMNWTLFGIKIDPIIGAIIGLIAGILIFVNMSDSMKTRNCSLMDTMYGELNTNILTIKKSDENYKYNLRDYYIKTAYNCCSGGEYRNDYVTLCSLNNLLKQGVRGLDFEIYSINDKPVVATSTSDNYHIKETFNSIDFSEILQNIINNAFSTSGAPNSGDPIIIHLRIKSENQKMYKNFAKILEKHNDYLLGKTYSYENTKNKLITNFGATPISELMGKISIIVDRSNPSFLECKEFYEYVNMTSDSIFMRELTFDNLQYSSDINELIEYNKQCMTIGTPNKGSNPANPSSVMMREMGCQMLAMKYQTIDTNLEENDIFFDENNSAFVLKPEKFRFKPIVIQAPPPQDPKLFYNSRTVKSDYYDFKI